MYRTRIALASIDLGRQFIFLNAASTAQRSFTHTHSAWGWWRQAVSMRKTTRYERWLPTLLARLCLTVALMAEKLCKIHFFEIFFWHPCFMYLVPLQRLLFHQKYDRRSTPCLNFQ
mmetsp:Transcript_29498/g.55195  ORF Transcript_29498/g.55195 Transcript_29498/m.55195 type:complete len:116 (-) Transcript_29498:483-830(-)